MARVTVLVTPTAGALFVFAAGAAEMTELPKDLAPDEEASR